MKMPWVSRVALELALDENARLRLQNDKLLDSIVTLQRKNFGMKERPGLPPDAPGQQQDPSWMTEEIPEHIEEIIKGYSSVAIRDTIQIDIRNARRQGTPWEEIYRLMTEVETEHVN